MNSQTWHILKQTEIYNKFSNDKSIAIVELEYLFDDYKVDLYAKTKRNKIIIVEVGHIAHGKLSRLRKLSRAKEIKFIYVPFPKRFRY
jgi:RecB family endonuclease NucS